MPTKLVLCTSSDSEGRGDRVFVSEGFDTVFDRMYPVQPPASNLEARNNFLYQKADGTGRVIIHPGQVTWVEENAIPED